MRLWSALTLCSYYQERQCAITVIQVCLEESSKKTPEVSGVANCSLLFYRFFSPLIAMAN